MHSIILIKGTIPSGIDDMPPVSSHCTPTPSLSAHWQQLQGDMLASSLPCAAQPSVVYPHDMHSFMVDKDKYPQ
jgi:hypothetical protein